MREILFRGKRSDKEWIYGSLLKVTYDGNIYNLIFADNFLFVFGEATAMEHAAVNPFTVGQFTGLTDKNGKKIFEGDIVHVHDRLLQCSKPYHEFDGVIEYRDGSFVIVGEIMTHYRWLDYDVTVLGNIHDNPELLGVEDGK